VHTYTGTVYPHSVPVERHEWGGVCVMLYRILGLPLRSLSPLTLPLPSSRYRYPPLLTLALIPVPTSFSIYYNNDILSPRKPPFFIVTGT
jgi:hypothetical protein